MTSEKPYMHCRQCGIRYRSDKSAEHDRQCPANDSDKDPSLSQRSKSSSSNEMGNHIRDTSEYYSESTGGKEEVRTRTVAEKDGVEEIRETVEYKEESPGGQNKAKTSSRSDSLKEDSRLKKQETNGKQEVPSQKTKMVDEEYDKKDIGNEPYPTEDKLNKEKKEIPVLEEKDPVDEFVQKLPEFDRQAETAYESHKQNLTPCSHCERTFTPDRIAQHERVCSEKSNETVADKK